MKLAFFGYGWGPGGHPDAYMAELLRAYVDLGFEVDFFRGNYFSADGAVRGIHPDVDLPVLLGTLKARGYDACVSVNNALLEPRIVEAVNAPVCSVIVDAFNHLFRYDDGDRYASFRDERVAVTTIGTQFEEELLGAVPGIAARLRFLPPATNGMLADRNLPTRFPISWVASLTNEGPPETALFEAAHASPDLWGMALYCFEAVETRGDLAAERAALTEGEMAPLLAASGRNFEGLEMLVQNIVTARQRVEAVSRLAPLGLALFGSRSWARAMPFSREAHQAFQGGVNVSAHGELLWIYNSSRISVNLPQASISESFQYRLLDVMSSNALLVTRRTPSPDLYRAFGADCPVPMFDSVDELHRLCAHYLAHEDERAAIVAACNALVDESYSFASRALDYLTLAGVPPQALREGLSPGAGGLNHVEYELFRPPA